VKHARQVRFLNDQNWGQSGGSIEETNMSDEEKSGDSISANIGDVSDHSQVAVGKGITQIQEYGPPPTAEDIAQLQQMFDELKAKIEQEVPPAEKEKALERVDELKEAVTAKEPDITTMEY